MKRKRKREEEKKRKLGAQNKGLKEYFRKKMDNIL